MQMTAKFVISCFQGRKELALENLALRQQLAVLNRNAKRPKFTEADRLFWVLYSYDTDLTQLDGVLTGRKFDFGGPGSSGGQ